MKNNRKNRKRVIRYFKYLNSKRGLNSLIKPTYLRTGKNSFSVLIGDINNPKSELIKSFNFLKHKTK